MSAFEELGVLPELISAVHDMGWTLPTPIQAEAVPLILGGGDVLAAAETGSGKTGAFALPVLQQVHETVRARTNPSSAKAEDAPARPHKFQMSSSDRDETMAVSPDGLLCQSRSEKAWAGGRALVGCKAGKVYYEATVTDEGLCRVGWATREAALELGTDSGGFGFGGTGMASHNKKFEKYGQPFGLNDTIGCLLDRDEGSISFTKNGQPLGVAFKIPSSCEGQALFPCTCLKNAEVAINFSGEGKAFKHMPPAGFQGVASAPQPSLVSGEEDVAAGRDAPATNGPTAIILEPARDLAEQTFDCVNSFRTFLVQPQMSTVLLIGGVGDREQRQACQQGVDVVVGTPARVMDFVERGLLSLANMRFYVLDEADHLLDTGNREAILKLFQRLPKGGEGAARLQTLMFSATLHSPAVRDLAIKICHNPIFVDLKGKDAVPDSVDHVLVHVDPHSDRSWLQSSPPVTTDGCHTFDATGPDVDTREGWSEAVKRLKPRLLQRLADSLHMDNCLVFVRTNFDANNLEKFLNTLSCGPGVNDKKRKRESGKEGEYSCVVLAGQRSMDQRRTALSAFRQGDVRFLICTDVAARGIDIAGLPFVVNMTLPDQAEDYVHRVGRVGRAEALGLAISLVATVPEKVWYCKAKGLKPWLKPSKEDVGTHEEGGHTIWYDEPQLLQDIEKRLSRPIAALLEDMSLPADIAARVGRAEGAAAAGYGQAPGDAARVAELSAHQAQVQPVVRTLAQLERDAQLSFFTLQQRFGGSSSTGTVPAMDA